MRKPIPDPSSERPARRRATSAAGACAVAAWLAVAGLALPAGAQGSEVCVECSSPAASYRCVVEDGDKVQKFRAGDKALQFLCVTELAHRGGHDKCRVRRDSFGACLGELATIGLPSRDKSRGEAAGTAAPAAVQPGAAPPPAPSGGAPAVAVAPPPQPLPPAHPAGTPPAPGTAAGAAGAAAAHPPAPAGKPSAEGPPRTVAEMAKRASESSGDNLKKAGGAVKKTWNCVISLFSDC